MAIFPVRSRTQTAVERPLTRLRRARLVAQVRDAVLRVPGILAALDWVDQHELSARSLIERATNAWWDATDWALRQPFEWAVTRARLDVKAYQWDLAGQADRLLTWACALEALAHARRALRDHPDIPEENGAVDHLENQALVVRAIATADRARYLHTQSNPHDTTPTRQPTTPQIEAIVGAQLDQLSNVATTQDQRFVILAQIKALLAPTLGIAVQVLHDIS
jgi:hypothetical protein